MPRLLRLPNEILCQITRDFYDIEDLTSFRLACSDVNRAVLPEIVQSGFQGRCVMLHRGPSLEKLIAISLRPDFGPAVKTLDVSLSHWPRFPSNEPWETVLDQQAHDAVLEDQQFLAESGLGTTYLAQAIAMLPSLKTVRIQTWEGWGKDVKDVTRRTGVYLVCLGNTRADPELDNNVVRRIVLTLLVSRSASVNELCLHFCIHPDMLEFSPPAQRHIRGSVSIPKISHLELWVPIFEQGQRESLVNLSGFIALFPGLQRLTLQFSAYLEREFSGSPEVARTMRLQGLRSALLAPPRRERLH